MPIIFQNPGLIDLRAVTTMGLHAKESKNPIGFFGTGLKYAISVILREGNQMSIWRGEDEYRLSYRGDNFRDKTFQFVEMEHKGTVTHLGFTLDLGKNWEIWQALRELESNCRDEEGQSYSGEYGTPMSDTTSIVVTGRSFEQAYLGVAGIFLQDNPIWEDESISIHSPSRPEYQEWIYYRGVRCQKLEKPSLYRYNIKTKCALTEDRTFKFTWEPMAVLTNSVVYCGNDAILSVILQAKDTHFEHELEFNRGYVTIPDLFCAVVDKIGPRCNRSAWKIARLVRNLPDFTEVSINPLQQKMLDKARDFIEKMGETRIREREVAVSPDLGKDILGRTIDGKIYLTTRIFEMGMKQLISCLYEEFIHADRGYADRTYEMQNFLFDTIITHAAKNMGEIL